MRSRGQAQAAKAASASFPKIDAKTYSRFSCSAPMNGCDMPTNGSCSSRTRFMLTPVSRLALSTNQGSIQDSHPRSRNATAEGTPVSTASGRWEFSRAAATPEALLLHRRPREFEILKDDNRAPGKANVAMASGPAIFPGLHALSKCATATAACAKTSVNPGASAGIGPAATARASCAQTCTSTATPSTVVRAGAATGRSACRARRTWASCYTACANGTTRSAVGTRRQVAPWPATVHRSWLTTSQAAAAAAAAPRHYDGNSLECVPNGWIIDLLILLEFREANDE